MSKGFKKSNVIPPVHIIAIELSNYNRILHELDTKEQYNVNVPHVRNQCTMEIERYNEYYKFTEKQTFETFEVNEKERNALCQFFVLLNGSNWTNKYGWVGLPKSLTRAEIKLLSVESSLFYGIILKPITSSLPSTIVKMFQPTSQQSTKSNKNKSNKN